MTKLGKTAVAISWPESLKKLASPTLATPRESQARSGVDSVTRSSWESGRRCTADVARDDGVARRVDESGEPREVARVPAERGKRKQQHEIRARFHSAGQVVTAQLGEAVDRRSQRVRERRHPADFDAHPLDRRLARGVERDGLAPWHDIRRNPRLWQRHGRDKPGHDDFG